MNYKEEADKNIVIPKWKFNIGMWLMYWIGIITGFVICYVFVKP